MTPPTLRTVITLSQHPPPHRESLSVLLSRVSRASAAWRWTLHAAQVASWGGSRLASTSASHGFLRVASAVAGWQVIAKSPTLALRGERRHSEAK